MIPLGLPEREKSATSQKRHTKLPQESWRNQEEYNLSLYFHLALLNLNQILNSTSINLVVWDESSVIWVNQATSKAFKINSFYDILLKHWNKHPINLYFNHHICHRKNNAFCLCTFFLLLLGLPIVVSASTSFPPFKIKKYILFSDKALLPFFLSFSLNPCFLLNKHWMVQFFRYFNWTHNSLSP